MTVLLRRTLLSSTFLPSSLFILTALLPSASKLSPEEQKKIAGGEKGKTCKVPANAQQSLCFGSDMVSCHNDGSCDGKADGDPCDATTKRYKKPERCLTDSDQDKCCTDSEGEANVLCVEVRKCLCSKSGTAAALCTQETQTVDQGKSTYVKPCQGKSGADCNPPS